MRSDEVRTAEVPAEASRPAPGTRSAPLGESFAMVLGPLAGTTPQGSASCALAVGAGPLAGSELSLPPNPLVPPLTASVAMALRATSGQAPALPRRAPRPDPLDPATRHSAQIAPLLGTSESMRAQPPPDAPVRATTSASLEEMLPALVRRIAWSGDGKKGSLRLEFGQGALAGGTLLVHSDDGRVRVELQAPPGTDTAAWRSRIASRLTKRGVALDEIVVE